MTTSICKAKNPATCPYHSAAEYQTAYTALKEAFVTQKNATNFTEIAESKKETHEAIIRVHATERGYQSLKKSLAQAINSGDFATEVRLTQELNEVEKLRASEGNEAPNPTVAYIEKVLNPTSLDMQESIEATNSDNYFTGLVSKDSFVTPENLTQVRAALKNSRGEKNGEVREVVLNSRNLYSRKEGGQADFVEAYGPKDGRPLVVWVPSGFTKVKVMSGTVIVNSASRSGNVVEVQEGATGIVLPAAETKVSGEAKLGGKLILVPNTKGWGLMTGEGDVTVAPSLLEHHYAVSNPRTS